jgi:ferredoxin
MMRVQPKPGADGSYPVDRAVAVSGEKLLRDVMLENKLELYAAYVREPHLVRLNFPSDSAAGARQTDTVPPALSANGFLARALQGKLMNCGGGGSCGTCIVEVLALHPSSTHRTRATGDGTLSRFAPVDALKSKL